MKIVSEFVDGPVLPVPDNLKGLIASVADCGLTAREMAFCYGALQDLGKYVKKHPLPPSIGCCILFSDKDEITLAEEGECLLGEALSLAVIQLGRIRKAGAGYEKWLRFVLLEEVCHILYAVRNEYRVKEIVAEVLSQDPRSSVDLHEFFPDHFDEQCRRIPLPEYPLEWVREHIGGAIAPALSSRMPKERSDPALSSESEAAGTPEESKDPNDASSGFVIPGVCETRFPEASILHQPPVTDAAIPGKTAAPSSEPGSSAARITPGICQSVDPSQRKREPNPRPAAASGAPAVSAPGKTLLPQEIALDIPGVCRTFVKSPLKPKH